MQIEEVQEYLFINNENKVNNANHSNKDIDEGNSDSGQLLQTVINNQSLIIDQQAKMQATLEVLVGLLSQYLDKPQEQVRQVSATESQLKLMSKPISTEEELNELEEKLKDDQFGKLLTQQMMYICGSDGKANGVDCAYKLIDYFLNREFVDKCSWTGNTRIKGGNSKTALKYFKNFRKCFLEIIRLADNQFSEVECDKFFKRILKNSTQRKQSNICSTHKNRPRHLKYKLKTNEKNCELGSDQDKNEATKNKDDGLECDEEEYEDVDEESVSEFE